MDHLKRGARVVIALSFVFAVATIVLFVQWPVPLIELFLGEDEAARGEIIGLGIVLLALAALFQLVDGAQVVALGLLRGVQDTTVPMILAAVSYWVIGIPVSYGFGFVLGWGAAGVWLGLVVGLVFAAAFLMYRFWNVTSPRITARITKPAA